MNTIKQTPAFKAWLDDLTDNKVRGIVLARIARLQFGLFGDAKSIGDGVSELRIDFGAGWRVYFTMRGNQIVILLVGGAKRTQKRDIKLAKAIAADWSDENGKDED
jgi:putative addiction module killer protein